MTTVSVLSVLEFHPRARIAVLMDAATHRDLTAARAPLLDLAQAVVVPGPGDDPRYSSRSIKLGLRETVAGDVLFLDADTVVVRPLEADFARWRVAALADDHADRRGRPVLRLDGWVEELFGKAGWPRPVRYFNSGVMWLPDTPETHRLCARWRERWAESRAFGLHNDQPALNAAIHDLPGSVRPLRGAYNVSVGGHPEQIRTAYVYHFWVEKWFDAENPVTLLDHLIIHFRRTGTLDVAAIARARRLRFPWTRPIGIRMAWRAGAWLMLPYTIWRSFLTRIGIRGRPPRPDSSQGP